MFAQYKIDRHQRRAPATWAAPHCRAIDRHVPGWRTDNASLRYALGIPKLGWKPTAPSEYVDRVIMLTAANMGYGHFC